MLGLGGTAGGCWTYSIYPARRRWAGALNELATSFDGARPDGRAARSGRVTHWVSWSRSPRCREDPPFPPKSAPGRDHGRNLANARPDPSVADAAEGTGRSRQRPECNDGRRNGSDPLDPCAICPARNWRASLANAHASPWPRQQGPGGVRGASVVGSTGAYGHQQMSAGPLWGRRWQRLRRAVSSAQPISGPLTVVETDPPANP